MDKDYAIFDFRNSENTDIVLPLSLNQATVEEPNFITNDSLLFISEDKIIKCYNPYLKKEEFMYTNCHFPGSG